VDTGPESTVATPLAPKRLPLAPSANSKRDNITKMIEDTLNKVINEIPLKWSTGFIKECTDRIHGMHAYYPGPRKIKDRSKVPLDKLKEYHNDSIQDLKDCIGLAIQAAVFADLSKRMIEEESGK